MKPARPGIRGLFHLGRWRRNDASREVRDEMELHIALRAEALVRDGMTPEQSQAEARRLFAIDDTAIADLHDIAFDRNRHMRSHQR